MSRPIPSLLLLLVLPVLLTACPDDDAGGSVADALDHDGDSLPDDVAADTEPETDIRDGDPGDLSGPETDATDAADAAPGPLAHCPERAPLPAWVAVNPDDWTVSVVTETVRLRLLALEGGALELVYTPPGEAIDTRSWALPTRPGPDVEAVVTGASTAGAAGSESVLLCTRELRVDVTADARVTVTDTTGHVLFADGPGGGWRGEAVVRDGATHQTVAVRRATPPGEAFYGLGERNGPLDRRGRLLTFWNTDAYDGALGGYRPDTDPLYLGVPLYAALREGRAYGVFTDNAHRLEVDVAASDSGALIVRAFGGQLRQYVLPGPALGDLLERYARLTGWPALPPRWALGYHQSRWGYAPDDAFEAIGAELRARGLPADALWLDIQHMDGFRTFTFDPVAFADPAGLIGRLRAQGFEVVLIADPGIRVDPGWSVYDGGLASDVFLRRPNGEVYEGVVWPGPSVFPDFSLARARAWWAGHVGGRVALGVHGIWLDVNEPTTFPESGGGSTIPDDVLCGGDGHPTTMAECHNVYALDEARATWDGMRAAAPARRPFILTRAGYAGIQRYAAVWTGDAPSTWTALRGTLPMLLGLGLSGVPLVGSDVGGYSGGATPELFARWMALGAVSPFFRGHLTSGVPGQEPWMFGQEVEDISREHLGWRYERLPYFYSLAAESARTGAPMLRPLVYEFQDDPSLARLDDQAMLGPFLLVAPVLAEGVESRAVVLPEGRWFELFSGAVHEGPTVHETAVTLAALPRYVREGAILPGGPSMAHSREAPLDPLTLDVYPGPEPTSFELFDDPGDGFGYLEGAAALTRYTLRRTAGGAVLESEAREGSFDPGPRTVLVRVRRVDREPEGVTLDGVALTRRADLPSLLAAGDGWLWDAADLSLVAAHPDDPPQRLDFAYDPALLAPRPEVLVRFEVTVPAGTPLEPPIHLASSANGWTHQPLAWSAEEPNLAWGAFAVPRGEWFFYKYTRGDWETVEKWPDCEEATDRYGFGAAHPGRADRVWEWRDVCEP
jgi:alpha-glucosidase